MYFFVLVLILFSVLTLITLICNINNPDVCVYILSIYLFVNLKF